MRRPTLANQCSCCDWLAMTMPRPRREEMIEIMSRNDDGWYAALDLAAIVIVCMIKGAGWY